MRIRRGVGGRGGGGRGGGRGGGVDGPHYNLITCNLVFGGGEGGLRGGVRWVIGN